MNESIGSDDDRLRASGAGAPEDAGGAVRARMRFLEASLRALDDPLRAALFWKDVSLRYVWASAAYAERLGRAPPQVVSRTDEDLFPAEVARLRRADDEEALAKNRRTTVTFHRTRGGGVGVFELLRIPIVDESSRPIGLLGIERDVAAQAAEVADGELNRLLLDVLMDALPDSVYFKDLQSRFLRANRATAVKFGLRDPAELVGKTDFDLFSRPHAQEAYDDEKEIVRRRIAVIGKEEKETWPDGRVSWVSTTKVPVVDADGRILGTFGITRDVTVRKQAQLALEKSERRYRELVENANDLIYTHDVDGNILSFNKAAERTTGYAQEEARNLHVRDLVAPEHRGFAMEMTRRKLEGAPTTTYELEIVSKDGRRVPLEVSTRILYEEGRPVAVQGIARDVAERKRAQAALERQADRLAEQARELEQRNAELSEAYRTLQEAELQLIQSEKMAAIGQLVAGLAHEINNPAAFVLSNLTAVERNVEDLLAFARACEPLVDAVRSVDPALADEVQRVRSESGVMEAAEEMRPLLDSMRGGMLRIRDIVASLRSYSRNDVRGEFEFADLLDGMEATLVLLRPSTPKDVVVELHRTAIPTVECNLGQVNQVFMNLIVNAIQAVGERGRVDVFLERSGDGVLVRVKDDGPGVAADLRSRIFDPFFTTKEVGRGTGLGLTICRRIVDGHQGRIEVESTPGAGAEFRVWLPLRQRNVERRDGRT
jgi:PAS domain S-box-containing protein